MAPPLDHTTPAPASPTWGVPAAELLSGHCTPPGVRSLQVGDLDASPPGQTPEAPAAQPGVAPKAP